MNAAIRLDPNYAPAYNSRAITYNELRQFDNALRDCDEAIRLDPNFPVFHNTRGVVLAHRGEYEKAIRDYNKAVDLNPGFADAYMNRGVALWKDRAPGRGARGFRQGHRVEFRLPQRLLQPRNTYADREDYDRAIRDYTRRSR